MSTFADLVSAAGMPGAWGPVKVSRPGRKPDPFNPARDLDDWDSAESRVMPGFIASSSSVETADGARSRVGSSAVLTCPDPSADVRRGDGVERVPSDGRRWRVTGFPSADASPFTGFRPTLAADLEEVVG